MMAGSGPDNAGNRYAAFLRGINVGGRRVTGQQLCAPIEALGFQEVTSFLASGNVTLATASTRGTRAPKTSNVGSKRRCRPRWGSRSTSSSEQPPR
jgi:hypothetical protein